MRIRNNRKKFQWILPIQKGVLLSYRQTHKFQEQIDRTLEYSTPAWLDDIIVATRGSIQDHER